MSAFFWPPTCENSIKFIFKCLNFHYNLTNILLYPLYLYFQLTFRHVLTMLAIFDCIFIAMASATFSLPLISSYWQVAFIFFLLLVEVVFFVFKCWHIVQYSETIFNCVQFCISYFYEKKLYSTFASSILKQIELTLEHSNQLDQIDKALETVAEDK